MVEGEDDSSKAKFFKNAQICVETFETARRAPSAQIFGGECFRTTCFDDTCDGLMEREISLDENIHQRLEWQWSLFLDSFPKFSSYIEDQQRELE